MYRNQIFEEDEEYSPIHRNLNKELINVYHDNELANIKPFMPQEDYNIFLDLFKRFLNIDRNDKK